MTDTPLSPTAVLVLARLLPAGDKGEPRDKLRKDLEPYLGHRLTGSELALWVDCTVDGLADDGLVATVMKGKKEQARLTDAGRARALAALGVDALPPKTTWAKLRSLYLPALALGAPGPKGAAEKFYAGKSGFEAAVLRAGFRLPLGDLPTTPQTVDALVWKLLGVDSAAKFTIPALKRHLFQKELGSAVADEKKALRHLLTRAAGARRDAAGELRDAVVRRWADGDPVGQVAAAATPSPAEAPGLESFAARVLEAARGCATGRFGGNKVFIAHVWRALRDDPAFRGLDADAFKARLAEANQARLLDLSRADLVEAMDPQDVRDSETVHGTATFHFVRL